MNRMIAKLGLAFLTLFTIGAGFRLFNGDLVRIDISTGSDVFCVGPCDVVYTAVNAGQDPVSYKWEWRCKTASKTSDWVLQQEGTSPTLHVEEGRVGEQEVRCTAHYAAGMDGSPAHDSKKSKFILVEGPSIEKIISGLNTDSSELDLNGSAQMTLWLEFQILCDEEHAIGCCTQGYAQERVKDLQVPGANWSAWTGAEPKFFLLCGVIYDNVVVKFQNQEQLDTWNNLPVGDALSEVLKQNRLVIANCHDQSQLFEFPTRHYKQIKTGPGTFKIVVVN